MHFPEGLKDRPVKKMFFFNFFKKKLGGFQLQKEGTERESDRTLVS